MTVVVRVRVKSATVVVSVVVLVHPLPRPRATVMVTVGSGYMLEQPPDTARSAHVDSAVGAGYGPAGRPSAGAAVCGERLSTG